MAQPDGVMTPVEAHEVALDEATTEVEREAVEQSGPQSTKNVPVPMSNGITLWVPLQTTWRKSALDFARDGDFDSWAESVLDEENLARWDEWIDTDPTGGELQDFWFAVGKVTGEAASGNRALRRSLRRTRTR